MAVKEATRRSGNCERAKVSTNVGRDTAIIPDWLAFALGAALGWPFAWWAVTM